MAAETTSAQEPRTERERILALYVRTRERTESLAARLSPEDQQLQSMPDASPTKWHRAHTTWFFETFVLGPAGIAAASPQYAFLFNSYYESLGPRHARPKRGLLSRPSAAEIGDYRRVVDELVGKLLRTGESVRVEPLLPVLELGIAHEEQHQELILTDILHAFSESPLAPAYLGSDAAAPPGPLAASDLRFVRFQGGLAQIGARQGERFAFDNERPRHKEWVEPFELASRLVTVRELKAFLQAGGYETPSLWLSAGFDVVRERGLSAPLHSRYQDGELHVFSLAGPRVARDDEPVAHVGYYEADAIARFLGARLPSEVEWEIAAGERAPRGNFLEGGVLYPLPAASAHAGPHDIRQLFGDCWEWTRSSYEPYPGYHQEGGALGEYNGKFMVNQRVLRGGSCLTPERHMRASYRNFWPADTRFQMTGFRLARDVSA